MNKYIKRFKDPILFTKYDPINTSLYVIRINKLIKHRLFINHFVTHSKCVSNKYNILETSLIKMFSI